MKKYLTLFILAFLGSGVNPVLAQTGIPVPTMSTCDNLVANFMNTYAIPGATFAMAKNGKLVYMRAFGNANGAGTEPTQPYNLFRIASVSKPITSIAIMQLIQNGQLGLDDKVFGPAGILNANPYFSSIAITDTRIYNITIRHLLEHSAGWNRDIDCVPDPTTPYAFDFNACDPISFPLHVTSTLGESNPVSERALVKFLLLKGLNFTPGTAYNYSNIGFLILGLVIEQKTGLSYENYVIQNVLQPLGICDMHLGKNLLADKLEREGEYIENCCTINSCYGNGSFVPWQYGGWNLEAMDAHGGWVATARDLVTLLVAVDGFATKPDILLPATITTMTTPSANNANYAKGWAVNAANNWWHTGSLDGTASFWARTSGGYTWAIILNKRIIGANSNNFFNDLDALPWNCIANTTTWPTHDLMLFPTQNSSNLAANNITSNGATVSWSSGNGTKRLIVAKAGGAVDKFPLDGTNYTANANFGSGTDLGGGNYVVYNGTSNSFNLAGLAPNTTYALRVFEYNQNAATGNYALYKLCDNAQYSFGTGCGSLAALADVKVFLQGPYVSAVQLMHDSLRVKNLIPLTEPYTGLTGFTHAGGGGGEQTTAAVLAVAGPNAIVDWVFLELRSAANPVQVLATRSALLQRDGDVVDVDGVSPVTFGVGANQSYYIVVRHRNHAGVQIGAALFYPNCVALATDFRSLPPAGFYSYNGLNGAEKLIGNTYVLWAGNGRVDFQLKYNGSSNDRTNILAVVGLNTPNAVVPGYDLADYNLDGLVKYNGSSNDRNVLLGNVGIATPSAVIHDQVAR